MSESDIQALKKYNEQLDLGVSKQTAFNRTLLNASENAQRMAESAKFGKVNIDNLAKSNDTLKNSYKTAAVEATLFNMAITMGITIAISKVMELVNWLKTLHDTNQKNTEEEAEKAKQRASNIDSELNNIKDLINSYKELAQKENLNLDDKLQIKDIQNKITQLVGDQADNLDLVNGKLDEQLSKLNTIYDTQKSNTTSTLRNAYGTAVKSINGSQYGDWNWIQKIANDISGTGSQSIFIADVYKESTFNDTVKKINDTFTQLQIEDAKATGTVSDFVLKLPQKIGERIDALDAAIKAMESQPDYQDNKIYSKLNEYRDEMYTKINSAQTSLLSLLDRLESDNINQNDANGFKSLDDYIAYRNRIVDIISDDTDIKDAIDKGLITNDTIQNRVDTYLSTLKGFSDYYKQWKNEVEVTTDNVVEQVDRFQELMEEKGTDKNPSFVESIEKTIEKFQKLEDALTKFESGTLKDSEKISLFKTFPELTAYADNLGEGIRNLLSSMRTDTITNFNDKIAEFKKNGATEEDISKLESYRDTILKIADAVDSVKNALDSIKTVFTDLDGILKDYNENGYFSIDNLDKLSENGQRYLQYLTYENGQLKINEEAYKKLVLAQIDEIETKATLQATSDLQSLTDETTAKEYLAKVNIELADSQLTAAQAAFQYALALKLAEGGNVAKAAQKVADNLDTLRNIFASARSQVDDYSAAMLGAKSATEKKAQASEKAKKALEAEQHALEHSKKALEQEKKALEENKSEYEKAQNAIKDLISWTEKYIKQLKEDEVKALEDKKSKFDEIIDAEKEAIEQAKKLREAEDELGEKTNTVAKAKLQSDILSLDDSGAGKKAYKKAQEEYKTSQKDLQDYLYNREVTAREEALDKLKEDTDKSYDEQIKTIQDYLSDEVQLYRDACSMIDNDNGTLYAKLLNYCLTYTTTGKTEFDRMWTLAQSAMEKYNVASVGTMQFMDELKGRIYDIDDAVDTLSKSIQNYEDRLTEVKNQLDDIKDAAVEAKNAIDIANSTPLIAKTDSGDTSSNSGSFAYAGRGYDASRGMYYYKVQYGDRDYFGYVGDSSDTDRVRNSAALAITKEIGKYVSGFENYGLSQIQGLLKVNAKNLGHYATGTKHSPAEFISQENGLEAIFAKNPNGSGSYTLTTPDSKVFDDKRTNELYDFSGNPSEYIKNTLIPLTQEELSKFGAWGDMSQVMTDNEILLTIKANDFLKQYNAKGNVPDNQILNNINIYNTINGDVTPQMLRLLEQKEKDIIDKSIGKSVRATQDMLLRGRNLR